ncbi:hypothetical protein [Cellulomonas triticagri]|uniref:hypothetical protein n=1 Tax=Cellulomonas triticagri TaxID=2483352 RepID=UPI0013158AAD|nr:hypothetical protein [Cellulomonas triticagri]
MVLTDSPSLLLVLVPLVLGAVGVAVLALVLYLVVRRGVRDGVLDARRAERAGADGPR